MAVCSSSPIDVGEITMAFDLHGYIILREIIPAVQVARMNGLIDVVRAGLAQTLRPWSVHRRCYTWRVLHRARCRWRRDAWTAALKPSTSSLLGMGGKATGLASVR